MTYTVTLNAIRDNKPCTDGWEKLLKYLGKTAPDNEPLSLITTIDSNGLDDALWCLQALPPEMDSKVRLFNCLIAERALKFWDEEYPDDKRPYETISVSSRFANRQATQEELDAARAAAEAAARVTAWDAERVEQEKLFREYFA